MSRTRVLPSPHAVEIIIPCCKAGPNVCPKQKLTTSLVSVLGNFLFPILTVVGHLLKFIHIYSCSFCVALLYDIIKYRLGRSKPSKVTLIALHQN